MNDDRRRYFRLNDTLGITYKVIAADTKGQAEILRSVDIFDLLTEGDATINRLLLEVAAEAPKVAALVGAFNQKLERITNQLLLDSRMLQRITHRVQEANISACGLGFSHSERLPNGTKLALELQLLPSAERMFTRGVLVDCYLQASGEYYWRIDFEDTEPAQQERLIQHILERQREFLKTRREPDIKM